MFLKNIDYSHFAADLLYLFILTIMTFRIWEIRDYSFLWMKNSGLWFMFSPILLNYRKRLSTLTAVLK